ncbi:hypothetical protein [Sphingopyxis solisilvae]|uniref:hypothetical protein n=1 Tax=Sphingopyxis solisilvae TaxID=1886788 RepID=UPI001892B161|nr:hypothetical protein [Sphingopyxis solisilvae]
MRNYEITAIHAGPHDPDRLIDSLLIEGTLWPIEKVIDWLRTGPHGFFVKAATGRARVIAARHWTSGRWFLTTEGQDFPPHDLLALRHVH